MFIWTWIILPIIWFTGAIIWSVILFWLCGILYYWTKRRPLWKKIGDFWWMANGGRK